MLKKTILVVALLLVLSTTVHGRKSLGQAYSSTNAQPYVVESVHRALTAAVDDVVIDLAVDDSPPPEDISPSPDSPSPDPSPSPSPAPSPSPSPDPSPDPSPEPDPSPPPPAAVPSPPPTPPPAQVNPQARALLQFKGAITNAENVPALQSWSNSDTTDPCTWGAPQTTGISCSNGLVAELSIPNQQMTGTIHPALASLEGLTGIDLSGNALSGSIPDTFDGQGALPNLEILKLSGNQLSGAPRSFGANGCTGLQYIELENNRFQFNIQDYPWGFPQLKSLTLQNNQITGGPLAVWDSFPPGAKIYIMPQQAGFDVCGPLPASGNFYDGNTELSAANFPNCGEPLPTPPMIPPPLAPPPPAKAPPPPPDVIAAPPPPAANPSSKSDSNTTAIIAGAVGGGIALAIIIGLLIWCCRPKKDQDGKNDPNATGYNTMSSQYTTGTALIKGGPGSDITGMQNSVDPLLAWMTHQQQEALSGLPTGPIHGRTPSHQFPPEVQQWILTFRDLHIEKQIGEGSFGRVYLAKWHETPVAVKVLLGSGVNIEDENSAEAAMSLTNPVMTELVKESTMMATLRHPNIVGFLGTCLQPPCIVTEYCARGSLTDVLRGGKASPAKAAQLDWARRLNMALDAAKGMLYLHAHGPPIIHRDLKSPNLLVDKHWRVKVSDFNLSKLMEENAVMSSMAATNPRWLGPEILTGGNATFASDVYSFAVVLWELLTWELPWGPINPWQVVTMVTEGGRCEIPNRDRLPGPDTHDFEGLDSYVALMKKCWAHNPLDRPSFQEIISELREMLQSQLAKNGRSLPSGNNGDAETPRSPISRTSVDEAAKSSDSTDAAGQGEYASTIANMTNSVADISELGSRAQFMSKWRSGRS